MNKLMIILLIFVVACTGKNTNYSNSNNIKTNQPNSLFQEKKDNKLISIPKLSMQEKEIINASILHNWTIPILPNFKEIVTLQINLDKDGTVSAVSAVDKNKYESDALYQIVAESAIRAVRKSSPIKGMPVEKYNNWRILNVTFDIHEVN